MIKINNYIKTEERYYIYGTSSLGNYIYDKVVTLYGKNHVMGFIETVPTAPNYMGIRVYSPHEIADNIENDVRIILASATHFRNMMKHLSMCGIKNEQIVIPYKIFDYFKTLYGRIGDAIQKICFWPPIGIENEDLIKKLSWFVPDRIEVSIWCGDENVKEKFRNNVYCRHMDDVNKYFQAADLIYIWRIDTDKAIYEKYISKTYVVDPDFYLYIETLNYTKLYYNSFSSVEKENYQEKSKKIFRELVNSVKGFSRARLFCSGPSIDEVRLNEYNDSINIICNSMVKDKEWLERIRPHILTFTDPNYYLSPTEYCKRFFEDVIHGEILYDYYVIVYEYEVPLLLSHYPELSGRVIGIANDEISYTYPSENQLSVKPTKNILTEMMIPIASALCDSIEIAGCTGRNPDENFYWKHNGRTQYLDLMQSIFDMYPSLFRDQNYSNYYECHCQSVEELLEYGEERGKSYKSITTSYIPALANRTVNKT